MRDLNDIKKLSTSRFNVQENRLVISEFKSDFDLGWKKHTSVKRNVAQSLKIKVAKIDHNFGGNSTTFHLHVL